MKIVMLVPHKGFCICETCKQKDLDDQIRRDAWQAMRDENRRLADKIKYGIREQS